MTTPTSTEEWHGRARMAAARLHVHGPSALDDDDREALRRHGCDTCGRPHVPGYVGETVNPSKLGHHPEQT